ncbi:MAG TPA: GNAT family N-acetyltransferase [Terriglobales bacterium]|nr:GNAT family N-acetyltransferase [Terriglobales bacterium]
MAAGEVAGVKTDGILIRVCDDVREFETCVEIQREVWQFNDEELVPSRLFVVARKVGGQVIGAFDGDRMVAFALGIPGNRNGHPYMHSHMLAVRAGYRNGGLGRRVKLFQREDALAKGIELIEWTFDPLEIKNAYLNIERLGAITRRYTINQYGSVSSPLQGGLPTDRLTAEWWLKSKRVETLLKTHKTPAVKPEKSVEVPAEIYEWKKDPAHREQALAIQKRNREALMKYFDAGLAVLGYERDESGNGKFLLGHWDEKWSYGK